MAGETIAGVPLYPQSHYVHELRKVLGPEVFEPEPLRALLVPLYAGIAILSMWTIATGALPWFLWPVASLVIGTCSACLAFVAHETLHGAIVRDQRLRHAIAFVCFFQFVLSPRLWSGWHDRVHHSIPNQDDDPDAYPTLAQYEGSALVRVGTHMGLGGKRLQGLWSVLIGFTGQSALQLAVAQELKTLTKQAHRVALAQTAIMAAGWIIIAALVGWLAFLFIFIIPLLVANTIAMSFILTNHSLSPHVSVNDPLVTSLSVTTPTWVDRLTIGFGYHVEHHVFPSMSSRHAPLVRDKILELWPERYQAMPLVTALRELHATARVYKDATTLVDPRTGAEFTTLLPRPVPMHRAKVGTGLALPDVTTQE